MHIALLTVLFSALIVSSSVWADHGAGPAFSDPNHQVQNMPKGWGERAVAREDWAEGAQLAVTLDQHLYGALLPQVQAFARERNLDIAVQEGTCGISAGQLEKKNADVGGFCCPPALSDRLPGLRFHTLAIGALAILVHPDNPVESLSAAQVRQIFSGELAYWNQLPGADDDGALIRTIGRLHCKARPGHWRLILDREEDFSPRLTEVSTIPDMIAGVAKNQDGIGYEVLWMTRRYANAGSVKALKIDGHSPFDSEALLQGRYPYFRTFNLTTWGDAAHEALADELVAYLLANSDKIDDRYALISAQQLRKQGWVFKGDELIEAPPAMYVDPPETTAWPPRL